MKSFKKLSLLALLAINIAITNDLQAETINNQKAAISAEFQEQINQNFESLINGNKCFDDAICSLEAAAQKENDPSLLEDIAFLKQNRKQIMTCLGRIKQLYAKIETYLNQSLKTQINNLGLAQWITILMK